MKVHSKVWIQLTRGATVLFSAGGYGWRVDVIHSPAEYKRGQGDTFDECVRDFCQKNGLTYYEVKDEA